MITRLLRSRRLVAVSAIAALILVGVLSRTVTAFNPQPDPPGFGMIGIAEGQYAVLSLVNLGPPAADGEPANCHADLQFFNDTGDVVATRRVNLKAGHAASLQFVPTFVKGDVVEGQAPLRAQIRGAINPLGSFPPGPCRASVEIVDTASSRTAVLYPPGPCKGTLCQAP